MKKTTALLALPLAAVVAFGVAACAPASSTPNSNSASSASATALGYEKSDKPEVNIASTVDKLEAWAEGDDVKALLSAFVESYAADSSAEGIAVVEKMEEVDKAWEGVAPYVEVDLTSEEERLRVIQGVTQDYEITAEQATERVAKAAVILHLLSNYLVMLEGETQAEVDKVMANYQASDTKAIVENSAVNEEFGELVTHLSTYTVDKDGYLTSVLSNPTAFTEDGTRLSFNYLTKDAKDSAESKDAGAYAILVSDIKNAVMEIETYLVKVGAGELDEKKLFESEQYKAIKLSDSVTIDVTVVNGKDHHYTITGTNSEDSLKREVLYDSLNGGFVNMEYKDPEVKPNTVAGIIDSAENKGDLSEIFYGVEGITVEEASEPIDLYLPEGGPVSGVSVDKEAKQLNFTYKGTEFKVKLAD